MSKRHHRPRRPRPRVADEDLSVATFVDAATLALEMPAVLGCEEIFVIVGPDGRVPRMVIDPLMPESTRIWMPRRGIAQSRDERILHVVVQPKVDDAAPSDATVRSYERIKRACHNLGRPLIDVMLTDGETVQSLSLALDPASPWLDDSPDAIA